MDIKKEIKNEGRPVFETRTGTDHAVGHYLQLVVKDEHSIGVYLDLINDRITFAHHKEKNSKNRLIVSYIDIIDDAEIC